MNWNKQNFRSNELLTNFINMIFFGILSMFFGYIKILVPGIEGASSDFREIPLVIGIFNLTNPLYAIGMAAISAISVPEGFSYFNAFSSHAVSMLGLWVLFFFIKKSKKHIIIVNILWFSSVLIYYLFFLIPLIFLTNELNDIYKNPPFYVFYKEIIIGFRFELISTAIIGTMYIAQMTIRQELIKHKDQLEVLVKERTIELEIANDEINSTNDELSSALENLKHTQANLIQNEKMASLGVLTTGVAHEINNPLNFIMGAYFGLQNYIETNIQSNSKEEKNIQGLLESMKTGVDRIAKIVHILTHFSNNESSIDSECDINKTIENCVFMIRNKLGKNKKIALNLCDHPIVYNCQNKQLHQLFLAILSNACQSIEEKGLINITSQREKNMLCVEIQDNGCGIKGEHLNKIYDPFFTTKDPGKGTGLGLSIAFNIVQQHKGKIEITSNEGEGTLVKIYLPTGKTD